MLVDCCCCVVNMLFCVGWLDADDEDSLKMVGYSNDISCMLVYE